MTTHARSTPGLAVAATAGLLFATACSSSPSDDGDPNPILLGLQAPLHVGTGDLEASAVDAGGALWRWGRGIATPTQAATGTDWLGVAVGAYHACALRVDGTVWCWGYNDSGQLGIGSTDPTFTFVYAPVQAGGGPWAFVAVGTQSTCAVRTDRTLWCWGDNTYGQLGDGTTTRRPSPVQVGSAADWVGVSMSLVGARTCGVRGDGTLWCWGGGVAVVPARVDAGTAWTRVAVDQLHACAVRRDGTLWCWGSNLSGQLGDGTYTDRPTPVQVGAGAIWATVSACGAHTCAVRADGTLWCWGLNGYGQLGDGTTVARSTPTQVGTAATWTQVSAGSYFTCATQANAGVWCWGGGLGGRLGNGTADQSTPVRVTGL